HAFAFMVFGLAFWWTCLLLVVSKDTRRNRMCPSCLYGFLLRSPAREWDIRAVLPHGFFYWVLIGLVAGWLAGKIARGRGFGCIADVVLGLVGSFVRGWVFVKVGIFGG